MARKGRGFVDELLGSVVENAGRAIKRELTGEESDDDEAAGCEECGAGAGRLKPLRDGGLRCKNCGTEYDPVDEDDDDEPSEDDLDEAIEEYTGFQWGNQPTKVVRVELYGKPRVLVEIGTLEAVVYSSKKGGERLAKKYIHDFEGEKPRLAFDPKTKRLFLIGGSYTITDDGIEG